MVPRNRRGTAGNVAVCGEGGRADPEHALVLAEDAENQRGEGQRDAGDEEGRGNREARQETDEAADEAAPEEVVGRVGGVVPRGGKAVGHKCPLELMVAAVHHARLAGQEGGAEVDAIAGAGNFEGLVQPMVLTVKEGISELN